MQKSHQDPQVEVQQKQCFLREKIIDNGHDPEEFVQFLNESLQIQSDLQKCSMKDLESVVQKFLQKRFSAQNQFTLNRTDSKDGEKKLFEKIDYELEPKKIFFKSQQGISDQQFWEEEKCVKVNLRYPDTQNFVCEVYNPERKNMGGIMGIGATSFLVFKVRVYGLQKEPVERRYSDFVWLRTTLRKFFPSHVIPPIPNKKASKRTPRHIQKRMRILTLFLNDLVKMPILCNNKFVEGFLLLRDQEKFQKLKEEVNQLQWQGENKKAYESIKSAETMSGRVELQLSEKTLNYKDCLQSFVPAAEILYKQITRNSKKVKSLIVDQINTLYEMGNQFGDLHELITKFNRVIKTEGGMRLTKIYVALNNMMVEWGNSLKNEVEEIEKNISTFFKYVREEFMGFHEITKTVSDIEMDFLKEKDALDRQKQKIFLQHDVKKWGIPKSQVEFVPKSALNDRNQAFKMMLPKQSVNLEAKRKNYGYYLSQTYINGNENFIRTTDRFCENFKEFSIKMKVSNQQIGAMWTEMSAKFSDPYKSNNEIQKMKNWSQIDDIQQIDQ